MFEADGNVPARRLSICFQKHVQHWTTDKFVDGVTELLGPERVDGRHGTGGIDQEVHGRIVLENRSPLFLAPPQCFFGSFALGDVAFTHG
jgi:hypothetical protein